MCRHSAMIAILLIGSTLQLAGCAETLPSGSASFSTPDGSSVTTLLSAVEGHARMIGASSQVVGDSARIVTYGGPPRDYITCTGGSQNPATGAFILDSRTTLTADGPDLRAETAYLVTSAAATDDAPNSIAFGNADSGRFANGTECRATGRLEKTLLGRK